MPFKEGQMMIIEDKGRLRRMTSGCKSRFRLSLSHQGQQQHIYTYIYIYICV